MSELRYDVETSTLRLSPNHLAALALLGGESVESGRAEWPAAADDLVRLGLIDSTGRLDEMAAHAAAALASPVRRYVLHGLSGGGESHAEGVADLETVVFTTPAAGADDGLDDVLEDILDVIVLPAVDLPLVVASLVELGPRPRPAVERRGMDEAAFEDTFGSTNAETGGRIWSLVASGADGVTQRIDVADLAAGGLWWVEREAAGVELLATSPTDVWAGVARLLRDLYGVAETDGVA